MAFATLNYPGSPSTALTGINKATTIVGNETIPGQVLRVRCATKESQARDRHPDRTPEGGLHE